MSVHNICFHGEIRNIYCRYPFLSGAMHFYPPLFFFFFFHAVLLYEKLFFKQEILTDNFPYFSVKNVYCGGCIYLLELPIGNSRKYPQDMFLSRNQKNIYLFLRAVIFLFHVAECNFRYFCLSVCAYLTLVMLNKLRCHAHF